MDNQEAKKVLNYYALFLKDYKNEMLPINIDAVKKAVEISGHKSLYLESYFKSLKDPDYGNLNPNVALHEIEKAYNKIK